MTIPKIIDGLIFDRCGDQSVSGRITPMATTFGDRFADKVARPNPAGVAKMRELVGSIGFLTNVRMDSHRISQEMMMVTGASDAVGLA